MRTHRSGSEKINQLLFSTIREIANGMILKSSTWLALQTRAVMCYASVLTMHSYL